MSDVASGGMQAESGGRLWGYVTEFETVPDLIAAAEKVRDAGYTKWDCHTPFPVHGLNDAMGLKPTILPLIVFGAGLTGAAVGIGLQWFTNAFDYPFLISGKPYFSLPANIPVMFELTILFAAITAFIGMLALNMLPQWFFGGFKSSKFKRVTSDRFVITIEAGDPKFDAVGTKAFMQTLGGDDVEAVED